MLILWPRPMHTLGSYHIMPLRGCSKSNPSSCSLWPNVLSHFYHLSVSVLPLSQNHFPRLSPPNNQSYKSMHRWTGCTLMPAKFYGVLAMSVIVFTSSSTVGYVPSRRTTTEWSKLLQNMVKVIQLAKSMSSQALLVAILCTLFEIQSLYGCHRHFLMPYLHGRFRSFQLELFLIKYLETHRPRPCEFASLPDRTFYQTNF